MEEYKLPETKLSIRNEQIAGSVLNILTSSIPYVGPILAEGLSNYWGKVKQERINSFVIELKEYFETVSNSEIDEEFIKSEDYAQIFEMVLRKVSDTKSDEKLKIFKDILLNVIQIKKIDDHSETFLNLVGQLTSQQINALKIIYCLGLDKKDIEYKLKKIDADISGQKEVNNERDLYKRRTIDENEGISQFLKQKEQLKLQLKIIKDKKDSDRNTIYKDYDEVYILDLLSKNLVQWVDGNPKGSLSRFLLITNYGAKFIEFVMRS